MGRKRKSLEELKTNKSLRLMSSMWSLLENEQKRLGHQKFINTVEHVIKKYFKIS